jgi:carboxyl-terminal processing protease
MRMSRRPLAGLLPPALFSLLLVLPYHPSSTGTVPQQQAAVPRGDRPPPPRLAHDRESGENETWRPQDERDSLSIARRSYIAARLYSAIEKYFAHWDDVPDVNLDETFNAYLDEGMYAADRVEFALASMAFLARFNNQHTWYFDWAVVNGSNHDYRARFLGGAWVVVWSTRDDLQPGDVIASIDGRPFEEFYREQSRYISASTERNRRSLFFRQWWRGLFPLRYTLTLADGRSVVVDRTGEVDSGPLEVEGRWIERDRIAYIKIPSWDGGRFQDGALAQLERFRDASGLVIDVRGNGGGSTPGRFINALMDRPWRWWMESTPMHLAVYSYLADLGRSNLRGFARPRMTWPATIEDPETRFTGRLAILIDEACVSACEDFAMPFKDNGRAALIGEATAGSSGQPYSVSLGDGMQFFVGAKREYFPDGSRFEGVGIQPDIRRVPTVADLRSGRDVVLLEAIDAVKDH